MPLREGDLGHLISRRAFIVAGVAAAGGGFGAAEFGPASLRHRLGLLNSPDHHVPVGTDRIESGTFASRHMGGEVGWTIARPATPPIGVVYCLHGRSADHTMACQDIRVQDVAAGLGIPLAFAACDGGDHSYWHPRTDGTDAMAMFFEEFMPLVQRKVSAPSAALMGWSMGGYGALLFAQQRPSLFRAVAVGSPALWTSSSGYAPGAFDSRADFERWDVFAGVAGLGQIVVRVDCGTHDPFLAADRAFVRKATTAVSSFAPGFHDTPYWRSVAPAQLQTIGAALR